MSPQELILWQRVQRRAASLTPELAAALLLAFRVIRDGLHNDADRARLIERGGADYLITTVLADVVLRAAFQPVRETLRRGLATSVRYFAPQIPRPPTGKALTIGFDILNPRVIDAVRTLDTKAIGSLADDIRATVRATVERGLSDGRAPRAIARQLPAVIGLGPTQETEVANFRQALEGLNGRTPFDYQLRDKRYDRAIDRARAGGPALTTEEIDRMVGRYRQRRIAQNAETIARTAALDAQKLGQRLAWEDAATNGVVDRTRVRKTWVGVMDSRERPSHVKMEGNTVGFDEPFSNGQMIPGDDEYGCRCIARYWLAAA